MSHKGRQRESSSKKSGKGDDHQHKERKSDSMDPYAGQSSVVLCAGL